jgi:uncharacterized membrane protein
MRRKCLAISLCGTMQNALSTDASSTPRIPLYEVTKFFHLAAGVVWLGGMSTLIWAVRPAAMALLEPPVRIPLLTKIMARFFAVVGLCIALLLATGSLMLAGVDMAIAPKGWHAMLGMGLLMCLIFAHLFFVPFRRLQRANALSDWPAAAQQLKQIHSLVLTNFALGWLAVAAVVIWR